MDDTQFWALMEQSRRGDCEEQADRLTKVLSSLTADDIRDFDRRFAGRLVEAYRWDLWVVAYIINGGCSDDGFEYFRSWLIGRGRKAFEAALADPQTVGDLISDEDDELECESLMYAAQDAYEEVAGTNLPPTGIAQPAEPTGTRWDENDLEGLFPALFERFG